MINFHNDVSQIRHKIILIIDTVCCFWFLVFMSFQLKAINEIVNYFHLSLTVWINLSKAFIIQWSWRNNNNVVWCIIINKNIHHWCWWINKFNIANTYFFEFIEKINVFLFVLSFINPNHFEIRNLRIHCILAFLHIIFQFIQFTHILLLLFFLFCFFFNCL